MTCPKCKKDRAHRSERKGTLDNALNRIFLKPYVCSDCAVRFHAFPSGVHGPTVRMELEQRIQQLTQRKGWKRRSRELFFYVLAALLSAGLVLAVLYFQAR
jgi:hypothetical protein